MSTWDNAIRHTRALESALDTKLSNYSRIGADIAGGGGVSGVEAAEEGVGGYRLVEEEVEELLDKVGVSLGLFPLSDKGLCVVELYRDLSS